MATNIWNPLGIQSTPFFQEALDISDTGLRPISLFVGRSGEVDEVLKRIIGGQSSRIVVAGLPGAGKTTLIQYIKAQLAKQEFAVSSEHCRVPHQLSATDLGVELLRSVVRSIRMVLPARRLKKLAGFEEARSLVEKTQSRVWQANAAVLGTGVGGGAGQKLHRPIFSPNQFQDALARLAAGSVAAGIPGIVVHLNSLENLEQDPSAAATLFRDARDYFLLPGLHVILGATLDFHGAVISKHAQVRSVFPPPLRLEALGFPEVRQVLERRYAYLRIEDMEVTRPVTWRLVEEFHRLFRGDLRGMLSALDETCYRVLGATSVAPLDREQVLPVLAGLYRNEFIADLTPTGLGHLERIASFAGEEFRQADVIDRLGVSQPRASAIFADLERAQAILHVRTDGPSRYYALTGRARIAFGRL